MTYNENFGVEIIGTPAQALLGLSSIAEGNLSRGIQILEDVRRSFLQKERKCLYARSEYTLGKIYLNIVQGAKQIGLSTAAKNIPFIVTNLPFAGKKAERHFNKAIEVAKEIGAKGMLGNAYFDLGLLHKRKGKRNRARECFSEAIQFFESCEAGEYLKEANQALESLRS